MLMSATIAFAESKTIRLDAVKDMFGRSNERNLNNGASPNLLVAHSPGITSIVSFDLSSITNEIMEAEFQIRMHNTVQHPIKLVVAPMLHTTNNTMWAEGSGVLGVRGRNAREGEATFAWRSFRDMPWETSAGESKTGLMDKKLWLPPIAQLDGLNWAENTWITVSVKDMSLLEVIRNSEAPVITFGLWGTSGNGTYLLSAKESGLGPRLFLTMGSEK